MANNFEIPEFQVLSEDTSDFDYSYKIILIGDSNVGKTCLTVRASDNSFNDHYKATVGFEICNLNLKIKEKKIKIQIWDTCGMEKFRSLITNFYRKASLVIIVYSIDDVNSYKDIDIWLNEVQTHTRPDIKVFLIGNKSDLEDERKVSKEEAQKLCKDRDLTYFIETSAKNGDNVIPTFALAASMLLDETLQMTGVKPDNKAEKNDGQYSFTDYVEDAPKKMVLDNSSDKKRKKKKCC